MSNFKVDIKQFCIKVMNRNCTGLYVLFLSYESECRSQTNYSRCYYFGVVSLYSAADKLFDKRLELFVYYSVCNENVIFCRSLCLWLYLTAWIRSLGRRVDYVYMVYVETEVLVEVFSLSRYRSLRYRKFYAANVNCWNN